MPSALPELAREPYDLLVVGGGIHGLFAAYDAAQRGWSVALVERSDFGSGLSAKHQRTLQGGLQELGRGHVSQARQLDLERRVWARIAPHYVRPLPFLVGTYRWTRRSRWLMKPGFAAYDFMARHRNSDVAPELHLPKARLESAAATRRLFPGIPQAGLTGGAVWYDYHTPHLERLTWTVALAAERSGARIVNYAEVVSALTNGGRVAGARVRDAFTGDEHEVRAAVTIVAGGGATPRLMSMFGVEGSPPLAGVTSLVLDRPARDIAIAARSRGGRALTVMPCRACALVGTYHTEGSDETASPPRAVLDAFLADIAAAFPALGASVEAVRLVHHGVAPAGRESGTLAPLARAVVARHGSRGHQGLVTLAGGSYAMARRAAARAVDAAAAERGVPAGRSRTASTTLPHAAIADTEGRLVETLRETGASVDNDVAAHLVSWYGAEAADVVRLAATEALLDRVSPNEPVLSAEVIHAVRHAGARRLADVITRRTPLGITGHPGPAAVARVAALMGQALRWDAVRTADEIARVDAIYPPK
jgi:glycerol-3-phosphate dehydrogenase